jgi:hypothetical protein
MTATELRDDLATRLSDVLGTYTWPNGQSRAAINLGRPPSDATAHGVEVLVETVPEYDNRALHQHTAIVREHTVRVIAHGSGDAATVVERICQAYDATNPTQVPALESLGVIAHVVVRVRA